MDRKFSMFSYDYHIKVRCNTSLQRTSAFDLELDAF